MKVGELQQQLQKIPVGAHVRFSCGCCSHAVKEVVFEDYKAVLVPTSEQEDDDA